MNVTLDNITFSYKDESILKDLSGVVSEEDRIGLIGENGSGKTTLLNIIAKKISVDEGNVFSKRNLTIGFLEQNSGLSSNLTVYKEMQTCFEHLLKAEEKMRELEQRMANIDHSGREFISISNDYHELKKIFESGDGYNIDVKIKTVLNGLGFIGLYDRVVETFSGGEKTRLAIAKLLLLSPELLILDEPTNHLDFETLSWLEGYLKNYKGSLLIVSHDRFFLDRTVNKIWELENKKINVFKGNYTKYKELKVHWFESTLKEYEKQQAEIAKMEDYVARNLVRASTAKSAQSRVKKLEALTRIERPNIDKKHPIFAFEKGIEPTKEIFALKELNLYAGEKLLFSDGSFSLKRGEKIAIVGENGRGKSTLLRYLVKDFSDRYRTIEENPNLEFGKNIQMSYYDQENLNLNFSNTVIDEMWDKYPRSDINTIRTNLGRMLFAEEDLSKKVGVLSGGERARLGFSIMMMKESNFMVLDEPTNHIDLQTRESLEESLVNFDGSILFVSHDRYFLSSVATKIVEIGENGITQFEMGFDQYLEKRAELSLANQNIKTVKEKKQPNDYKNAKERKEQAKTRLRIKEIEKELETLENEKQLLSNQMLKEDVVKNYQLMQEILEKSNTIDEKIIQLYDEWEEIESNK